MTGATRLGSHDARLELAIGRVELVLAPAAPRTPLAPPRTDLRPLPYAAAALVAHLAFWAITLAVAAPPPPARPMPTLMHLARLARVPTTPLPPPLARPRAGSAGGSWFSQLWAWSFPPSSPES